MTTLRIALAQVNPTVGDLENNRLLITTAATRAARAGASLVAFGEMALTGYPLEDKVFNDTFAGVAYRELERLAEDLTAAGIGDMPVIVGYFDTDGPTTPGAMARRTGGPRNALAVIHRGSIVAKYYKHYLPNYGVFDEARLFVSGRTLPILRLTHEGGSADLAVCICEDLWRSGGPVSAIAAARPSLVLNINGSPYEQKKDDNRHELVSARAREFGTPVAYVNLVGGQDDLVFEGDSLIVDERGSTVARAAQFEEELLLADLEVPEPHSEFQGECEAMQLQRYALDVPTPRGEVPEHTQEQLDDLPEVWSALVCGLRDYARKNGFRSALIGLSGGIDSALTAVLALDALGADAVHTVAMPSEHSSAHSVKDAAALAETTGVHHCVISINAVVDAIRSEISLTGVAAENLQARARGIILMGLSNQEGHLVLPTGNKSEYAVGYSTLYGDMVGGFAPLKDTYKTLVYELAEWRNQQARDAGETPPIPENTLSKPPSAELAPGQLDSDSLPDYTTLDAILRLYIEGDASPTDAVFDNFDSELVTRVAHMVDAAEYKRRQSAPGIKITAKAFGRDRRVPITQRNS